MVVWRSIGKRTSPATAGVATETLGFGAIVDRGGDTVNVLANLFVATTLSPWQSFSFSDDSEEVASESDSSKASRFRLAFASSIVACV